MLFGDFFEDQPSSKFPCSECKQMDNGDSKMFVYANDSIKDSGNRTVFETGAVRDIHEGKGRMDLLPWAAIMEVSKHSENGAKKYGEHNVDKGIPTSSLCDSLQSISPVGRTSRTFWRRHGICSGRLK